MKYRCEQGWCSQDESCLLELSLALRLRQTQINVEQAEPYLLPIFSILAFQSVFEFLGIDVEVLEDECMHSTRLG